MGNNKLSDSLRFLAGFRMVLGTTEHAGGDGRALQVTKGIPLTWDSNNGVTVVYDEDGRPWIQRGSWNGPGMTIDQHILRRGAHVPHSNDGGVFVHEVLHTLPR